MRGYQRRTSIERKILTPILWVGIIPITIALLVGYAIAYQGQRKAVLRTLSTAAQTTTSGLRLVMESRLRAARALARDPEVIAALSTAPNITEDAKARLRNRLSIEKDFVEDGPSAYGVYDANGVLIFSTRDNVSESDKHQEYWVTDVHEAQFVDFKQSYEENRYFARIAAPVLDPATTNRIGFLCEDQDESRLLFYALGEGAPRSSDNFGVDVYQIALSNERGGLLMNYLDSGPPPMLRSDDADLRLQSMVSDPAQAESGALRLRNYRTRGESQDVLLAYYRFMSHEGKSVYIVVYRPSAAVFANINQWALYSLIGAAVVISLFLVFVYRSVHNTIVLPLSLLNEGAQIIRQGDLDLKLKVFTGDEVEELATSFNKMALHLSQNVRQLEESEEKYRSLITSMRDGIYQTDTYGMVTFANPAGAEIIGFSSPEEAVGQSLQSLFVEEIDYGRISSELVKQGFVERTRIWMRRKDEREICVELSANRVTDDDGNVIGAEGIFRDVTITVRFEEQARERSERIRAINQIANVINSSLESGRLHESLIVELKKLVDFDYAAVALFDERGEGYEKRQLWPEQKLAGQISALAASASTTAWVAKNRRSLCVDDINKVSSEHVGEFPEGTVSCLCVPLYATGRIIGTLNLGAGKASAFSKHDVDVIEEMSPHIAVAMRNARLLDNLQQSLDEVTRAREKLHEVNEELKTLDEMKTNLLSNVSHELRTPLVSVMGYTDMLFNRKVGPVNEVQAEYLGIIMRNVEKLVTLIENLLDFSRLHRGTEKMVFAAFDLVDCARISVQTVQPVADSRNIKVSLTSSDEKVFIEGDKGKMGQVFNNLLSNAVKFNANGGAVAIQIRRKEDSIEVTVSDTGIGIPQEAVDKVFTRFYQYDSSSTRKYGGTGIGLSIAQDIVRLHGSRITVTSELGKGSVFRFSLPLKPVDVERRQNGLPSADAPLPSETHLLVALVTQDRGLNLQVIDLLTPEGINVVHASHAESALDLIHRYHPDCILLDVDSDESASGEGSHPLVEQILADEDVSGIPVVLFTNNDAAYSRYRARVAGRVRHGFRKSGLLSGIHYALNLDVASGAPLGGKILCVDDDPEILTFISRCLQTEGYVVDKCSSGQAALERVATREYGLVLLDIAMPGLDGWEVCRMIKSDSFLTGIKIHLVTAKPIDRSTSRLQDVGADGYLSKPFRAEDLIELVHGSLPLPSEGEAESDET
jgi:PAS domain S-box-containing protein